MTTASARSATSPLQRLLEQAWADLQPFEGRMGQTWRVALLCALVTGTAMIYHIPEASISCYLIIFLMKPDAVMNCLMGVGLIGLASTVVLLMIPVINFSIDSPVLRLAIMFGASYVFIFLSSTTPLGEQAAIVGLIVAFIMTLVTDVPIGEIADKGLMAAWKMACMPMALMVLFNLFLGIPAHTHVRSLIATRLDAAAAEVEAPGSSHAMPELLAQGNDPSLQQMLLVRLLHLVPRAQSRWLNGALESSYRLILAVQVPPGAMDADKRTALAPQIRDYAAQVRRKEVPAAVTLDEALPGPIRDALTGLTQDDGGADPKPAAQVLFAHDAFTNPRHQRYALKTSVAAMLCYLIYTGIQWDGIHTALITCYVAALGTTGETVRKLTLRIVGCLVGAAMGCAALLFVMPWLTSVGGLMILVFLAVMVGAWVASGSERISYAGVQIALAFLLTTLNGFGPSFDFSQAGNRIMGILLGIVVIYVIFTQFWPASIAGEIREKLADTIAQLKGLATRPATERETDIDISAEVYKTMAELEEKLSMAAFEPRHQRADAATLQRYDTMRADLGRLCREIRLDRRVQPEVVQRLSDMEREIST
ncbi:FUSC family protein [Chachezhania sediminis]|uniref:FUSC family protein n=1 Tax=Chachezhania sediminis TaxID=2599291 RepID=UPI00131AB723|nr:FUSC family protein [Chachezhania sediminis]